MTSDLGPCESRPPWVRKDLSCRLGEALQLFRCRELEMLEDLLLCDHGRSAADPRVRRQRGEVRATRFGGQQCARRNAQLDDVPNQLVREVWCYHSSGEMWEEPEELWRPLGGTESRRPTFVGIIV